MTTALPAHEPPAPIRHCRFHTVSLGHLGRVRLDPVTAILAPDDQRQMRLGGSRAGRDRISPSGVSGTGPSMAVHNIALAAALLLWRAPDTVLFLLGFP